MLEAKKREIVPTQKSPTTGGCPQRGWGGSKRHNRKNKVMESKEIPRHVFRILKPIPH
jgi:hypothetical protein